MVVVMCSSIWDGCDLVWLLLVVVLLEVDSPDGEVIEDANVDAGVAGVTGDTGDTCTLGTDGTGNETLCGSGVILGAYCLCLC